MKTSELNQKTQEITSIIASEIKARHGRVLENGKIDGVDVGLEVIEEISGGKQNLRYFDRDKYKNGKLQVRIGAEAYYIIDTPSVGFKQLKDGSHNYAKIADKMVEIADYVIAVKNRRNQIKQTKNEHLKLINSLKEQHGLLSTGLSINHNNGSLSFIANNISEENAKKLVEFAKQLGIVF